MSVTENILKRLEDIWQLLLKCDVVAYHSVGDPAVDEFRKILNNSVCITERETTVRESYRFMYRKNPQAFSEYITAIGCEYLSLVADGIFIAKMLRIMNVLHIQWSQSKNQFMVTRFGPKPESLSAKYTLPSKNKAKYNKRKDSGEIIAKKSNTASADLRYTRYNPGKTPQKMRDIGKMISILSAPVTTAQNICSDLADNSTADKRANKQINWADVSESSDNADTPVNNSAE